jgi:hypothetical protein
MRRAQRSRRGLLRFVRPPRGAGLMLAVPAFLAIGTATMTLLLAGVSALLLAPAVRSARRRRRSGRTITLHPSAYRHVDDARALTADECARPSA